MRAKITLALCAAGLMGIGLVVAACGGGTKEDAGTDASLDDTGVDTGADTGKDTGVPTGCQALDGGNACRSCCVNEHPDGALYFQGAIHACVCAGMFCNSCAGTYCAMPPTTPTQACADCAFATLSADGGPCVGPVGNACAKTPDCVAWFQCNAACK